MLCVSFFSATARFSDVKKAAKEFIDSALAARARLGDSAKVSKRSYGRAVDQATDVFERL
jgi:hypothetical protein